jgi:hypothetical protein
MIGSYHGQTLASRTKLGQVFNFRYGCVCTPCTIYTKTELPNLKWKTQPKQLLGSLPLAFALPVESLNERRKKETEQQRQQYSKRKEDTKRRKQKEAGC